MGIFKNYRFWCCILFGVALFALIFPYNHDIYIAPMFTAFCIVLNLLSSALFSVLLFITWTKKLNADDCGAFFGALLLQGIGHGVFATMSTGSWVCLGITVLAIIGVAIVYFKGSRIKE